MTILQNRCGYRCFSKFCYPKHLSFPRNLSAVITEFKYSCFVISVRDAVFWECSGIVITKKGCLSGQPLLCVFDKILPVVIGRRSFNFWFCGLSQLFFNYLGEYATGNICA